MRNKSKVKYNLLYKRRQEIIICLVLVATTLAVYWQITNHDFINFDDGLYVTENSHVQAGLTFESIKWAFTTYHAANWHPLTWLSHMLDYELYGLVPMGHHWTNLQFHIANTLLLFFILQQMTGALWKSAFVAALFALHPLHVESVAWVSERKDVLSTFFGLLTILSYCFYVKQPNKYKYLAIILFLSLGLMAKPMLVTLPFLLLLLDFWPLERFRIANVSRLVLEKIPLFVPVVISSSLTFIAQQSSGAVKPLESFSLTVRIANAFVSYASYVVKAIWPHNLTVFYPHPGDALPLWQIFGAILLVGSASFLAIRCIKKYPYIAVGLFMYLWTLVPVVGLVQVGDQAMADRYTYIPLIGIFIIIAWGASDFFKKWHYRKIFFGASATIILTPLIVISFYQLMHWQNGITLFENAIKVTENNHLAHNNLGAILEKKGLIDEAIGYYSEALRIKPNYAIAHNNLGAALLKKGNYHEAVLHFKKALKINPQQTDALNNLANVLFFRGKTGKAICLYKEILKIDSENSDAQYNLAYMLSIQGKFDEAVLHYREAIRINPEYAEAHYHLGNILINQGKMKQAMFHFAEAIRINPEYAEAYNNIGVIFSRLEKFKQASIFFSKAIEVKPDFTKACKNLEFVNNNLSSKENLNER